MPVPMLHWPDSMFTYDATSETLFSNDGFGQHIACTERWADEMSELEHVTFLLQEYCANILGPFKPQLQNALQKAGELKI